MEAALEPRRGRVEPVPGRRVSESAYVSKQSESRSFCETATRWGAVQGLCGVRRARAVPVGGLGVPECDDASRRGVRESAAGLPACKKTRIVPLPRPCCITTIAAAAAAAAVFRGGAAIADRHEEERVGASVCGNRTIWKVDLASKTSAEAYAKLRNF